MQMKRSEFLTYYNALRSPDTHKGDYGRVYIFAGSRGMTGAATLCAKAALRSGAGLVYMAAPGGLIPIYEINCIEAVKIPLDADGEHFTQEHVQRAADIVNASLRKNDIDSRNTESSRRYRCGTAVVIGPGIGTDTDAKKFVRGLMEETCGSGAAFILDADGLNAFNGECGLLRRYSEKLVITPHAAELSRLTGMELSYINSERTSAALKAAALTGAVTVLKGSGSVIAGGPHTEKEYNTKEIYDINTTGNPGMATGGSGDVLSGIAAGIMASDREDISLYDAVRCAVYIHGLCGDIAAARFGQRAVTAGDLIEMLKEVHNYGI